MSKVKSENLNDVRAAAQSAVQAPQRSMQITCTLKSAQIEQMRQNSNSGVFSLANLIDDFGTFNKEFETQIHQATTPMDIDHHDLYDGIMFSPTTAGIQFLSSLSESKIIGVGCSLAFITPPEFHFHDAVKDTQSLYGIWYKALNVANDQRVARTDVVNGKQCGKHFHDGMSMNTNEIFNINYPSVPNLTLYGVPANEVFKNILDISKKIEEKVGSSAVEKLPEFAFLGKSSIHLDPPTKFTSIDSNTGDIYHKYQINAQSYLATWMATVKIIDKIPSDKPFIIIDKNQYLTAIYTMAYAWGMHRNTTFNNCGIAFDFKYLDSTVQSKDIHFILQLEIKPFVFTRSKDMSLTMSKNLESFMEQQLLLNSTASSTHTGKPAAPQKAIMNHHFHGKVPKR